MPHTGVTITAATISGKSFDAMICASNNVCTSVIDANYASFQGDGCDAEALPASATLLRTVLDDVATDTQQRGEQTHIAACF